MTTEYALELLIQSQIKRGIKKEPIDKADYKLEKQNEYGFFFSYSIKNSRQITFVGMNGFVRPTPG